VNVRWPRLELAEGGYGRQARGGGQVPSSFQARQRAGRASGKIPCGGRGSGGKGAPGAETARDRVAVPAGAGRGPDEAISTGGITAPALRGAQDRRRRAVGGGEISRPASGGTALVAQIFPRFHTAWTLSRHSGRGYEIEPLCNALTFQNATLSLTPDRFRAHAPSSRVSDAST
jgi:hypothetical protein